MTRRRPSGLLPWTLPALALLLLRPAAGLADAYDPTDDTPAAGNFIGMSTSFQRHGPHTIAISDQNDWFRVSLSAGQTYHFDTNGAVGPTGSTDTVIEIYSNPSGGYLARDDDGGCGLNSSLDFTPSVSTLYYIKLHPFSNSYTITGYLNYWIRPASGSPLPFTPVAPTGPASGVPCDRFDFTALGADPLERNLGYEWDFNGDSVSDYTVAACGSCVYGCAGFSSTCFGSPGVKNVRVRVRNTANQVSGWSPALSVVVSNPVGSGNDAGKGVDAGDTFAGALSIGGPGTVTYPTCVLDPCEQNDTYKFYAVNGTPLSITVQPCATLTCDLTLYAPSLGWRASDSANGKGVLESVSYTADATGLWYVQVSKFSSGCFSSFYGYGQYTLAITGAVSIADLHATVSVSQAPVNVGMWYDVVLQVQNTGAQGATNVLPWINVNVGPGRVTLIAPPPGGPVTIGAGSSQSFTWTYSASGAGPVSFTATATGQDATYGFSVVGADSTGQIHETPAILGGTVSVSATTVKDGGTITMVFTASNTGQAAATGVTVMAESSSAVMVEGAGGVTPAGVTVLGGGATQVWTWTFDAVSAPAIVRLTATIMGTDANSGAALVAAATSANISVIAAAVLRPSVSITPSTVHEGEFALVTLTTTNVGTANATGMRQRLQSSPAGLVVMTSGPAPGTPVAIPLGGGVTSTSWTLQAVATGTLALTASLTGVDAGDGSALTATAPGGIFILPLVAPTLVLSSMTLKHGDQFTATLTLSNTGAISATLAAPLVSFSDPAAGTVVSGPAPAGGVVLQPGESIVYVWSLQLLKSGSITISAGAAGVANGIAIAPTGSVAVTAASRFPSELAAFPNPVKGDVLNVTIKPDRAADRVLVEVYNMGRDRVYSGVWRDVDAGDADLVITGVSKWAPGLYFVRAHAEFADGRRQEFAFLKVAVKR